MKSWIQLLGIALGMLALTATVGFAKTNNLVVNPNFEAGTLAPWAGVGGLGPNATIEVLPGDSGPSGAGTFFAFLNNHAEANGLTMAQTTPNGSAVPGSVFYSFDLKLGTAANGGVFFVEIFAQNAVGAVIGGSGLLGNYAPGGWTAYNGSFVAPAGTDHLTIQFEAPTGAVPGSVSSMMVDNVSLSQLVPVPVEGESWGRLKALYQ